MEPILVLQSHCCVDAWFNQTMINPLNHRNKCILNRQWQIKWEKQIPLASLLHKIMILSFSLPYSLKYIVEDLSIQIKGYNKCTLNFKFIYIIQACNKSIMKIFSIFFNRIKVLFTQTFIQCVRQLIIII